MGICAVGRSLRRAPAIGRRGRADRGREREEGEGGNTHVAVGKPWCCSLAVGGEGRLVYFVWGRRWGYTL
jgi:hypothetical protein